MVDGFRPSSLIEALEIRARHRCLPIAGGTDLMVRKARGFGLKPDFDQPLLFISHLDELHGISESDGSIHIGAGVLLADMLNSEIVPAVLNEAIALMASPPSRNLASIGGNICNASPAGDTLPYLYAVDARLVLKNQTGQRVISIEEFITGSKTTDLRSDELLTEIIIPKHEFPVKFYRKVGQRKGMSLTKASFLGLADMKNGEVMDVRIAFGSVAPTVVRSRHIEKSLTRKSSNELRNVIPDVQTQYADLIQPIDDARSTAAYRRSVGLRLLQNFLQKLCKEK